jgi:hypothetical protein
MAPTRGRIRIGRNECAGNALSDRRPASPELGHAWTGRSSRDVLLLDVMLHGVMRHRLLPVRRIAAGPVRLTAIVLRVFIGESPG